jgi:hypothetical protein
MGHELLTDTGKYGEFGMDKKIIGYNASLLFRNLQKRSLKCKERGTLQTCFFIMVSQSGFRYHELTVWHPPIKRASQGRIQDFKLGGEALKKNCTERRETRTFLGNFVWKITILRQKIIFLPILGGGGDAGFAPPWTRPCIRYTHGIW